MRRRSLIGAAVAASAFASAAQGHALFPGQQTIQSVGDRAFVHFQAVNARRDVSEFVIEVFEGDSWIPSNTALASPKRIIVPAADPGSTDVIDRPFSVLVDLDGQDVQKLRVCTKTVLRRNPLRSPANRVNTRVCSNVVVKRFR